MPAMISSAFRYLQHSLAQHFFHRRQTRGNFRKTASPQRNHSQFECFFLKLERRGANQNQFAQLVADLHHFVQTNAPFVPGVVARAASAAMLDLLFVGLVLVVPSVDESLLRHLERFLATGPHATNQALSTNQSY